ncbi:hypothetical protein CCUS01_02374, partial [Colletotrichum cuscutae]
NSFIKFSLFFVLKKDKELRLISNYKNLIKLLRKYYLLLLITKLRDSFYKTN